MDTKIDPKLLASQAIQKQPELKGKKSPEDLKKVCQQFEAVLVHSMFKEMRNTVPDGGLIPRGQGEDMYREMLDWEIAQSMAKRDGLGIAEVLYRQIQGKDGKD